MPEKPRDPSLPPVPPPPSLEWLLAPTRVRALMPVPRVPVRDERAVEPTARVAGQYAQPVLEDVVRAAKTWNVPEDLALAMTIREQSTDLANPAVGGGDTFRNPLQLAHPPAWTKPLPSLAEPSMMHAVERASVVAPQGVERQVQAYNGLGAQAPGYNERFKGQPNPYAKAVEEIRQKVVNVSPALLALMKNVTPKLRDPLAYADEELRAIGDTLTRQVRHPNLLR